MAATTHEIGTADTGATPNTSGAFTPALNDLLIVAVVASGTADTAPTLTNSAGLTFTLITRSAYSASANSIYIFVSNALVSSATSQTVTVDCPADSATGTIIFVEAVAGMTRTGLGAILQFARQQNQSAGGTPTAVFGANVNTNNVTIGVVGNSSSPAGLTPPTSWTEPASTGDLGFSTPTTGGEVVFRDSGFSSTTVTWGSTSATVFGTIMIELDTSVPSEDPFPYVAGGYYPTEG